MEQLTEYIIPVVAGICLCVGYILKKWVKDLDNKYIPTILAVLGLVLAVWINGWVLNPSILFQGILSGLASTGAHQMFKQYVEGGEH